MLSALRNAFSHMPGFVGSNHTAQDPISVTDFVKANVAGALTAAVDTVGALGVAMETGVRGAIKNWRAIWGSDRIGFDSKVLLSAAGVPVAAAALQPLSLLSGGAYGFAQGFDRVLNRGLSLTEAAKAALQDVRDFEQIPQGREEALYSVLLAGVPEDCERPYDVSLPRAVGAVVAAVTSAVVLSTSTGILSLYRTPEVLGNVLFKIWSDAESDGLRDLATSEVVTGLTGYANALLPVAAGTFGYGLGLVTAHTQGFDAAMDATWKALRVIYRGSRELVSPSENVDTLHLARSFA